MGFECDRTVYFLMHVRYCAWLARLNGTACCFDVMACFAIDNGRPVSQALVSFTITCLNVQGIQLRALSNKTVGLKVCCHFTKVVKTAEKRSIAKMVKWFRHEKATLN